MSAEVSKIANSPLLWAVTVTAIALVIILAVFSLTKSIKVAKHIGITKEQVNIAIKTSCLSSIGPSLVIMVGMISLLVVVGAPTAMMRLSVVGNVNYELQGVGLAADAFGTTASAANLTPEIFQTAVFLMAFGCVGYLIVPIIFCNSFEKVLDKINGGGRNKKMSTMVSAAAILCCYAYVDAPYILRMNDTTIAMIAGFGCMLLISAVQKRTRKKWLLEWGMLIAMFFGMLAGNII